MYLTVNRRFDFCASRLLRIPGWSDEKHNSYYGTEASGRYGQGRNYTVFFVFNGVVDPVTGMLVNLNEIKSRLLESIESKFDHKNLNLDPPPFADKVPTPENVALELLHEARMLFAGSPAQAVACHLQETPTRAATAFGDGHVESHFHFDFSAARRTWSPHLSDAENTKLFGSAASKAGHGHHYRVRVTYGGETDSRTGSVVPPNEVAESIRRIHTLLDHKHLSEEVKELSGMPMTTECLARYIFQRLGETLPVRRVTLRENDWFSVEYDYSRSFRMGINDAFSAMHRLHTQTLSKEQNSELYGKCSNPRGHGHYYTLEATASGQFDERTGTLYPLFDIRDSVRSVVAAFDNKYLDEEVAIFRTQPSTGENIVSALWHRLSESFGENLHRVRLGETLNNRFTVRRNRAT